MNNQYNQVFNQVMKQGVCNIYVNVLRTKTQNECKVFSYGIVD